MLNFIIIREVGQTLKKLLVILAAAFFLLLLQPVLANEPQKYILENGPGIITWLVPDAKLTTISLWVKSGSLYENKKNSGISHFIEHLIFKGTAEKNGIEIVAETEALGGNINGMTSQDFTCYYLTLPSDFALDGLKILSELVTRPAFKQTDLENEKKVIVEEIFRQDEEPVSILKKTLYQTFFNSHPYSQPVTGTPESLNSLTRQQILEYYQKFYTPNNLFWVIAGNFDREKLIEKIKSYFPATKQKEPSVKISGAKPARQEQITEITKPLNAAYFCLGWPAPAVKSRDSYVADVLIKILSAGKSSRLPREIKEKKNLVSEIEAEYSTRKEPGIFTISAQTNPLKIKSALQEIKGEISQLAAEVVSARELQKAKDQVATEYFLNLESSFEKIFILGYFEAIDSYLYGLNYLTEIQKVTTEDIQKTAQKYFSQPPVIVILKPDTDEGLPQAGVALQ